ncbi:hypothetical protein RUM43_014322 [Polyplax serrata]|uniref:Secreted protein n=1 Tax=Polyplax serrata TaxID=468196 RepID=A0AAN8NX73_POLSC
MIGYASFIFCVVSLSCIQAEESAEPAVDPYLSLTAFEFLRRGNPFLLSPLSHLQWTRPRNEIETNEIDTGDGDRVPVLQFRRYDAPLRRQWTPPGAPELEVVERKKREADKQETVLIGDNLYGLLHNTNLTSRLRD